MKFRWNFPGTPIKDVILCLRIRSDLASNTDQFTVYDFATSDTSYSQLLPINISATLQNGQVCAHLPSMDTTSNYFPIVRLDNWENQPFKRFDGESIGIWTVPWLYWLLGLIYTLAVLFLVVSALAILKLVVELILNIRNQKILRKLFKLKHNITLFTFLFNFSMCFKYQNLRFQLERSTSLRYQQAPLIAE